MEHSLHVQGAAMSCNGAMLQRGHFDSLLNMMATHVLSLHMQERKCALSAFPKDKAFPWHASRLWNQNDLDLEH